MFSPEVNPTFVATRAGHYVCPSVGQVPLASVGGTGSLYTNSSLSDGTVTATIANTNQPETARELVIFTNDASGTNLSIKFTINYTTWDGTNRTYVVTLTSDGSVGLPCPVVKVNSLVMVIANSAVSDAIRVGYGGFWTGTDDNYITAIGQVLNESIAGVSASTAGTIPQRGFYLPNSVSATNSIELITLNTALKPGFQISYPLGTTLTPAIDYGTNPTVLLYP